LPREPYRSLADLRSAAEAGALTADPLVHTIVDHATGEAVGTANYMRIDPASGVIEIGSITYSPRLQRRPAGTEAMYLMMRRVFDELGYRRYEWKCNSLNQPSRNAAVRLGFQYEGLFRQAQVVKGGNRDTAWFSILDSEWAVLRAAFEAWLDPANFAADGTQRQPLASFRPAPA
jgi:RimJ/RimL family protein N-acetyltransferase